MSTIENTTNHDAIIQVVSGPDADAFRVLSPNLPFTLQMGQKVTLNIECRPVIAGAARAQIDIQNPSNPYPVFLRTIGRVEPASGSLANTRLSFSRGGVWPTFNDSIVTSDPWGGREDVVFICEYGMGRKKIEDHASEIQTDSSFLTRLLRP